MTKKVLSLLLALTMIFSMTSISAFASDPNTDIIVIGDLDPATPPTTGGGILTNDEDDDPDALITCDCVVKCTDEAINEDCPVCATQPELCVVGVNVSVANIMPATASPATTANDTTSLNAAIVTFNGGSADMTIEITADFTTDASTPITAISNSNTPTKTLTIKSDSTGTKTITRGKTGDLFTISAGELVLEKITIDGGKNGASFNTNGGGSLAKVESGAIFSMGNGATLQNNIKTNENGGGVSVSGTFNMGSGATIKGNKVNVAGKGAGGVYIANGGTFNMNGGTITNNETAFVSGGGVALISGTFNMYNGTITNNTAPVGGGVMFQGGTFTMHNGTISGNTANSTAFGLGGGGVCVYGSTFNMNGGAISGNTAADNGGGVWVNKSSTFNVKGSAQITGNGVYLDGGVISGRTPAGPAPDPINSKITIAAGGLSPAASIGIEGMGITAAGTVVASGAASGDDSKFYISNAAGKIGANTGFDLSGTNIVLGAGAPPPPPSSGGSSSSKEEKPAPPAPVVTPLDDKASGVLSSAINAAATVTSGESLGVKLKNVSNFTKANAAAIIAKAKALGKPATVSSDIMSEDGKYVEVRITVDPALIKNTVRLDGYTRQAQTFITQTMFKKHFENKTTVVSLAQTGKFGQTAKIAAKVDLSGFNSNNLYFYSYDKKTSKYTRIEKSAYRIDKKGYLHFETDFGGDIIISDGKLEKK